MKKNIAMLTTLLLSAILFSGFAQAHCQIPCGIYDDETRMTLIYEHIATIEKSMNMITQLENEKNANQLVRWVMNKDKHAEFIQEIVTEYFMAQRIKFDAQNYDQKLKALHEMLFYSMKCKQTTDLGNVEKLKKSAQRFHDLYFTS
ncbi:superoxide dismutase [Ni] [Desulforhopalus singaporensis]|uniref:Nickel superoxide dismutase n=1 Tax=Desulforhopalus singaporensis TaxID=91360 RepID=A0A1H0N462_9BACT|nr:superoxide dismutase [Ni] [Desulforhopalus singaporensis]SDO87478.1 nickel superoxide dismutase [Desulforhopalus singaporensis]